MVLLGRYNAQGLGDQYEVLLRVTPGIHLHWHLLSRFRQVARVQCASAVCTVLVHCTRVGVEYVKCVLSGGRLVGALLLGETGLEETFENLIANAVDVAPFADRLLDPELDIDDFFD